VRVPQWLVETKAEDLDLLKVLEIDNAGVRREFIRKVGLDRLRFKLGAKTIDKKVVLLKSPLDSQWPCRYEVIEMDFGKVKRRALVMDNPSLPGTEHVEYLPNDVSTVEAAMNFRLNRTEADIDPTGKSPYWLHGDVVVKPKGQQKWNRWPEIIA
jgi:hypothetical protein